MNKITLTPNYLSTTQENLECSRAAHSIYKPAVAEHGPACQPSWNGRIIAHLNKWDTELDARMPNFVVQEKIDKIALDLKKKFAPLNQFNVWLNSNGKGDWFNQFAVFLVKLPARAMRNVINLVYNLIEGILYSSVHPLKASNHLVHLLALLASELSNPETYSKMGSAMTGSYLGHVAIAGTPLSTIGVGVGAAMTIGGLSFGALRASIQADAGGKLTAIKQNLSLQAERLPESFLTGFLTGLLMGGVRKAIRGKQTQIHEEQGRVHVKQAQIHAKTNMQKAEEYARDVMSEFYDEESITDVKIDASGKIIVTVEIDDFGKEIWELSSSGVKQRAGFYGEISFVDDSPEIDYTWEDLCLEDDGISDFFKQLLPGS